MRVSRKNVLAVIYAFVFIFAQAASANSDDRLNIAVVYPPKGESQTKLGLEAYCATEVVQDIMQASDNLPQFHFIETERTLVALRKTAETINSGQFDAVLGTLSSNNALILLNELDGSIPLIAPIASADKLFNTYNNFFSVSMPSSEIAAIYGKYIGRQTAKNYRVSIVVNETRIDLVEFSNSLKDSLKGKNLTYYYHPIYKGFDDYEALVAKIIENKPDVIILLLNSFQAGTIYMALAANKFKGKLFGGGSIGARPNFLKALDPETKYLDLVFIRLFKEMNEIDLGRLKKYLSGACKDLDVTTLFATAYDAAMWVARAGIGFKGTQKQFSRRLRTISLKGVTGSLSQNRHFTRPLYLFRIKDRKVYFEAEVE